MVGSEPGGGRPRGAAPLVLAGLLGACRGTPPPAPDPQSVTWARYSNRAVGFSLDYPDVYTIREDRDGRGVLFRYEGYPVLVVRHVDAEEAHRNGLWVGHDPVGRTRLAGRAALLYDYLHYDGPSSMRTVSRVVEHRGKYLGLEFRTELDRPDAIQQHVLDSFRIDD